jgi:hypothetical protein
MEVTRPKMGTVVRTAYNPQAVRCKQSRVLVAGQGPGIRNRLRREAICHLLATDTLHRLLLHRDKGKSSCHVLSVWRSCADFC